MTVIEIFVVDCVIDGMSSNMSYVGAVCRKHVLI